jgi:hypothetical protein
MAQELARNHNSNSLPTLPGTGCTEQSSTAEVSKLIARCLANYGERKGADMRLVTAEWHGTLGAYPADRLHNALSEHIRKSRFWPTVADLTDILREAAPAPGIPRHRAEPDVFAREGRTEAEEIAYRAAQSLRWKQQARAEVPEFHDPLDAPTKPKEASQDMTVSDMLRNSLAVKRATGAVP